MLHVDVKAVREGAGGWEEEAAGWDAEAWVRSGGAGSGAAGIPLCEHLRCVGEGGFVLAPKRDLRLPRPLRLPFSISCLPLADQ